MGNCKSQNAENVVEVNAKAAQVNSHDISKKVDDKSLKNGSVTSDTSSSHKKHKKLPSIDICSERSQMKSTVPFGMPIEEVYDGVYDGHVLGSGISGIVRRVTHIKTGINYAMKRLDLGLLETDEAIEQLREEIFIMCQLDHPNIIRLEEVYQSRTDIFLVLELCGGGELFDRLEDQPDYCYTEQECAKLVKQILDSVRYIHSKGIIHRDLKLENFLFSSNEPDSELKMIDFGLSKHFQSGEIHEEMVGTPYTVAPEVIQGKYDERCDVWAVGVITYLLLCGDPPFGGCGGTESLIQLRNNILSGSFEFEPEYIWENVSQQAKDFICQLLVTDPQKRPTALEARKSPWFEMNHATTGDRSNTVLNPDVVNSLVGFKKYSDIKKLLCEVLSFTLLPDQIRDLRKEFEKLDKDGSGEISLQELKEVLITNARSENLGALSEKEVEDMFEAMRCNPSEMEIRWHEFLAAGLGQCKIDDRNLRLAFDRLDNDRKGYVTMENIVAIVGCDDVNELSKCAEYEKITYDDFVKIMKGHEISAQGRKSKASIKISHPIIGDDALPRGSKMPRASRKPNLIMIGEDEEQVLDDLSNPRKPPLRSQSDEPATSSVDEEEQDERPSYSRLILEYATNEIFSSITSPSNFSSADSFRRLNNNNHNNTANHHPWESVPGSTKNTYKKGGGLQSNRDLYRNHRQMRLSVMENSKVFEDYRLRHSLREINNTKETSSSSTEKTKHNSGTGLVMKRGSEKQMTMQEFLEMLRQRQEENDDRLKKANRQAGRGKTRKDRTISDVTGMMQQLDENCENNKFPEGNVGTRATMQM